MTFYRLFKLHRLVGNGPCSAYRLARRMASVKVTP